MSLLLLIVTLRGVSNKHCLLPLSSSTEPLGSQGELIVYPSSRCPSVVRPSSTIFSSPEPKAHR